MNWHILLFGPSDIALYIAPFFFLLFADMDGRVDGFHFDRLPSPRQVFHPDIHRFFMWRRIGAGALLFMSAGLLMLLACCLMFPWIHDNRYYDTRHDLSPKVYPDGYFSEPSDTSTAIWDLSLKVRGAMAIIGLALMIAILLLK